METAKANKRILYLDYLRVFTIFAMMMLHVSATNWGSVSVHSFAWQVFNVFDSLVRFSVSVFIMISGVFFLDNKRPLTITKLFKKNIMRLLIAYIFWAVVYSLYTHIIAFNNSGIFLFTDFIHDIVFGHYHLWFLFTLVSLYLIVPLLRKISADIAMVKYFIILFIIFSLLINTLRLFPNINLPLQLLMNKTNLHFVIGYTGYFFLGYYLANTDVSKQKRRLIYILGIISVFFTIVLTSILSTNSGYPTKELYSAFLPTTFFCASALFLFFKYNVSKFKLGESKHSFVLSLSRVSFGMYLVHILVLSILEIIGISTLSYNPILAVPVNTLIVYILSFIVSYMFSKSPFLKRFV